MNARGKFIRLYERVPESEDDGGVPYIAAVFDDPDLAERVLALLQSSGDGKHWELYPSDNGVFEDDWPDGSPAG